MSDKKERAPRLGRGLASLLGDAEPADISMTAQRSTLALTMVSPGPFQPRQDMSDEALDELAMSIRAHGVIQPILVRPVRARSGLYEIIAGERRWRAAQRAGLHEIPVYIRDLSDADAFAAALIENLQRQDLNAIEEAEGLRRLGVDFGFTQDAVASSVGKSRSHVANTMRLLSLPNSVQNDVRRGALSAGHARALIGHADPVQAAMQVVSQGLTVRQTEALSQAKTQRPRSHSSSIDARSLEQQLTGHLGLVVAITPRGKGGQLCVRYGSLDQLEGLIKLLKP